MNDYRLAAHLQDLLGRQERVLDVGLDLDGVHFWFDRAYVAGCKRIGRLPADMAPFKATRWEFYLDLGHTLEEFLANCHTLADAGLLWAGDMIPGSRTVWDAILDAGHRVHIITDRSFGASPVVSELGTHHWLTTHQRVAHSVTFTADKTSVPTDVMLEDKLENYDALTAAGCHAVLINRPWNAAGPCGDTRVRVENHDEFLLHVLTLGAAPARVLAGT